MTPAMKKSLLILLAIMLSEAVPFAFMLLFSASAGVARLYAFQPGIRPAWLAGGAVTIAYVLYAIRGLPLLGSASSTFIG